MITEDYVSFEIAELLKEKGFDEEIETLITPTGKIYFLDENSVEKTHHKTICNSQINTYSNDVSCPTLQMSMKWLREVHKLFITIDWTGYENEYIWSIQCMNGGMYWESDESYILYEHACEAACIYALKNLI